MNLDWESIRTRANSDGEFQIHARFWNSIVRISISQQRYKLVIENGKIQAIEPWFATLAGNVFIDAPEEDWEQLLEESPKPFYQDLYPAAVHHGFEISGAVESYCAYYPAIRRLIEIMREVNNHA